MRRNIYKAVMLSLSLSAVGSAGCSEGGKDNPNNNNMNMTGDGDMAGTTGSTDMAGMPPGKDGGTMGPVDMTVPVGIPCIPGTYRCGGGLSVEICNSSGTAWLYSATCSVSCMAGLCTGACDPGVKRCNAKNVETCNAGGSAWNVTEMCSTFCDSARCAIASLDVAANKSLDGDQLVDGDIIIRSGATLTSPKGDLTLRTRGAILVEMGASIVVNPSGDNSEGQGGDGYYSYQSGGGGGYGTGGGSGSTSGGAAWGSTTDLFVSSGSSGGRGSYSSSYGGSGGRGGGVLRLMAEKTITIAGQVTANGSNGGSATNASYSGGGGGSGGGVLLATPDKITISGSISTLGGGGGSGTQAGGNGGQGRVKLLNNGTRIVTGSVNGAKTEGLIPPLTIAASSHPSQDLYYNDDFPSFQASWNQAFTGLQGYYYAINATPSRPPNPGNGGKVSMTETINIPASDLRTGENWFHIVPIDSMSNVGTVENTYRVRINSTPPSITSSSHPSSTSWYAINDVYFQWSLPQDTTEMGMPVNRNFKGVYYVLDRYGETIPTSMATFSPLPKRQQLFAALANGIWVLHMVPSDQRGYLTKTAAHYRVQIGVDPGRGTLLGQVVDSMGKPVPNARVTVNRGLFNTTTNAMGSYNFMTTVPAGTWEIKATSSDGLMNDVKMDTLLKDGTTTVNLTLK